MRDIDLIVIHCAATKPSMDIGVKEIRQWHLDRGWSDIGYHRVIRRDGTIEPGRPESKAGAHAKGFNSTSIGICLVGGLDEAGSAVMNYTAEQWVSLKLIVSAYVFQHEGAKVCGHNDLTDEKTCPNFDVDDWWVHA